MIGWTTSSLAAAELLSTLCVQPSGGCCNKGAHTQRVCCIVPLLCASHWLACNMLCNTTCVAQFQCLLPTTTFFTCGSACVRPKATGMLALALRHDTSYSMGCSLCLGRLLRCVCAYQAPAIGASPILASHPNPGTFCPGGEYGDAMLLSRCMFRLQLSAAGNASYSRFTLLKCSSNNCH